MGGEEPVVVGLDGLGQTGSPVPLEQTEPGRATPAAGRQESPVAARLRAFGAPAIEPRSVGR